MSILPDDSLPPRPNFSPTLGTIVAKLAQRIDRDALIQAVVQDLRRSLNVNRVALYYFFFKWKGRVIFESIESQDYSIFGMTGADNCFNDEYAALYEAGRYRAIEDIEVEPIEACHRDFLRSIQVKANLVVPVLTDKGLWGLLAAHHCQSTRTWSSQEVEIMQSGSLRLATSPTITDAAF